MLKRVPSFRVAVILTCVSLACMAAAGGQVSIPRHDQAVKDLRGARELARNGQLSKAEVACLRAIDGFGMGSGVAGATDLLGEIYLRQGLASEAFEQFAKFSRLGRDSHVDLLVVVAAARTGEMRAAKLSLATYLMMHQRGLDASLCQKGELPGMSDLKALEATGMLLLGADETATPDQALEWLKRSDALEPKNAVIQYLMGKAHAAKKEWRAAKSFFSEAAKGHGKTAVLARERLRAIPD